jgi:hypothetical protein
MLQTRNQQNSKPAFPSFGIMSQNMKLTLFDLPHTAWDRVARFVSDDLDTLLRLSSMSQDLQQICRPYTSAHFRRAVPKTLGGKHAWLYKNYADNALVHMVLSGDVDPSYILEYACSDQFDDYNTGTSARKDDSFIENRATRPGLLRRPGFEALTQEHMSEYDRLARQAIESSRWILPESRDMVFDKYQAGDQDAAALILLPLLTKLKAVEPPIRGGLCSELFSQVARESSVSITSPPTMERTSVHTEHQKEEQRSGKLPFSELLVFYLEPNDTRRCVTNFWLHQIRPFLSIRSLRRIVLHGIRDWELENWPSNLVPISCPEIYFALSSVNRDTILELSRDIAGPCTLIQWYEMDVWYQPSESAYMGWEPDWDHLHVEKTQTGDRTVWTSLKCDGGVRGDEWPWVSWLWHRHMQDWEKLGEPFLGNESDSKIFELTHSL